MSALTEVSEADELKAAVAATGEPRLIALLERLAVVEGKLADGGADLRAAIDAWNPPTSSGQAAKTRLAELLTRLEAVHNHIVVMTSTPSTRRQVDSLVNLRTGSKPLRPRRQRRARLIPRPSPR